MKDNKKTLIWTTLVCLIPVIAGIILYPKLPDELVTHWDFNGVPNGYSSKPMGAIGIPGILLLLNVTMPFLAKMDPKYHNINQKMLRITFWIIPIVSLICSGSILFYAMGINLRIERLMPGFLGLLFIVIGNYLPKTKQSYTMGIKIPWTLHSEENWNKTHRLAGFLWVAGGIVCLASALLGAVVSFVIFGILIIMVIVPMIYSYILYKKGI